MKSYFVNLFLCFILLVLSFTFNSCRKDKNPPSVTTSSITDITQSSVISGGNIINDGGDEIITRGVCWATNPDPTINDFITNDGNGTGEFSSLVTGLSNGATYYLRAYATNSFGTGYGNSLTFTTVNPSTESIFKPTGVVPATEAELLTIPTIESLDESLIPSFNDSKGIPSSYFIKVPSPEDQGNQNSCTAWTVGYGLLGYLFKVYEGHNNYEGLERNFSPHYIWNQLNLGRNIGCTMVQALWLVSQQGCCKTTYFQYPAGLKDQPTDAAKLNAAKYKITSAYRFLSVNIDKMKFIISRGYPLMICINIDKAFQAYDGSVFEKKPDGRSVWNKYSGLIRNPLDKHSVLICGYDDHINAFKVLNSWGGWGEEGYFYIDYDFIKDAVISIPVIGPEIYFALVKRPIVTKCQITDIRSNSAQCVSEILEDWEFPVTQKGVCWSSANTDPTIEDKYTSDGDDIGSFTSVMNNLTANTLYFVKAYAINSQGISYGLVTTFTTPRSLVVPTVTVNSITNYTQTTATCGGNVTNAGGGTVTAKGVCWNTSQNPTISNYHTTDGTGLGSFSSSLTGLTPGMTYYVRAYATNSVGTGYSTNQVSFITPSNSTGDIFNPNLSYGSINDVDGNSYRTIQIGTQTWMAENLKTSKLNDNTALRFTTSNAEWGSTTTPAYCWYNDDVSYKANYGALYNWYAVNTGRLCPNGWHVPSDSEWTTLENYLITNGYNYDGTSSGNKIAKALASQAEWFSSTAVGTPGNTDYQNKRNASGWSGLPGGIRDGGSASRDIGRFGRWKSSTVYNTSYYWIRQISNDATYLHRTYGNRATGDYVRCIRD
ncbi:MAG: hypothetical protein JXB49_14030 [Bacteroidales bacterium]|nr:hypothetical protein [Bacteroidales bacterium]